MNLSNARYVYGLATTAAATSINVTGDFTIGIDQTSASLTSATSAYSLGGIIYGSGNSATITVSTGATTGTTFVTGNAQVETATAAGSITGTGNASVVFTSAAVTGSPVTISVAVTSGDSAATWAAKVRTALAANTAIAAAFDISGATTAIIATRKIATILASAPVSYYSNDATLNISLDNGTCTGITTAASSANTTAGVATSGAYIIDGDGKDFEGTTLPTITAAYSLLIQCTSGDITPATTNFKSKMPSGGTTLVGCATAVSALLDTLVITANSSNSSFTLTVLGS